MNNISFGEWLHEELKRRDWSKADLARAAGVSAPHITRIMSGEQTPGNEVIVAIARALDKPPEEVFRRVAGLPLQEESPGLTEWATLFFILDPEQREEIMEYARFKLQQKRGRGDGEMR